MPITFYPHLEDSGKGSLEDRLELLITAAEKYKAAVLDAQDTKPVLPRDVQAAYNWDEIAAVMREIRELPEGNKEGKTKKGMLLTRLAEIYEVLRAAKMPKLEAVRLALVNEKRQLVGGE